MESRLVRSVGSRGPAGGVMGNVIVPAVWIGWGVKGWGEKPWKKREGRGHLNYLCSLWPLSPSVSLRTDPLSERRCTFPQADAHPPPLFNIAIAPFREMQKLNCNIFFPLMHFSRFMSLSKKKSLLKENQSFFFLLCVFMFDHGTWPGDIRLKMYNKIKRNFPWTEQFSQTYSAGYMQLS